MNKSQKEVQQANLNAEKAVIKELKQIYAQAINDCQEKISALNSRTDMQNLQSIIYQKQYQGALEAQLSSILTNLQSNEYQSVTEYLTDSYTNGYTGIMYDIQQQTGCTPLTPINQASVVAALQTDSKISTSLYNKLGEDVTALKKSIKTELSRGIANGSSWLDVAANIASGMNTPYKKALNNAIRIARTEGHRVQNQSALDAMNTAAAEGADVVKQWDAALDARTRPEHRVADGQIRELNEAFEVGGEKLEAPGVGGSAWNVCNCRCCVNQRARWALDDDKLKKLKDEATSNGLDGVNSFEDFKNKYSAAIEKTTKNPTGAKASVALKTVDDCTDFSHLQQYFKNTYGVIVDDDVGKLDYASVWQSAKGIEKIIQEFPQAQATLTRIATGKNGVMCARYNGTIAYNPAYYSDASKLNVMIQGNTTGYHPKNTGLLETGNHEMGHLLERTLIKKSVQSGKYQSGVSAWNNCTEAKAVISEACKAAKKTIEGRDSATGKLYKNAQLRDQVSGYANKNASECLAECVGDYVANGENASILSKEVWKILKRELG